MWPSVCRHVQVHQPEITFSNRSVPDSVFRRWSLRFIVRPMPHLDYGNATLGDSRRSMQHRSSTPVSSLSARLIHRSPRYDHITPLLRDVYWLRSPDRAHRFQVSRVLVYRCLIVSLLSTYLITSNMLPFLTVDDFVHRHRRCY